MRACASRANSISRTFLPRCANSPRTVCALSRASLNDVVDREHMSHANSPRASRCERGANPEVFHRHREAAIHLAPAHGRTAARPRTIRLIPTRSPSCCAAGCCRTRMFGVLLVRLTIRRVPRPHTWPVQNQTISLSIARLSRTFYEAVRSMLVFHPIR